MGCEQYNADVQLMIQSHDSRDRVLRRLEFVPDAETELYFKAADVVAIPYTEVSQSGVLVLGYSFGLPVIASDVGSLRDNIVEGRTGFICRPRDPTHLAEMLTRYFASDLFRDLANQRLHIQEYCREHFSWDFVGGTTAKIYRDLLSGRTDGATLTTPRHPGPEQSPEPR
jgi:glycosyltransferase involved in cell wall biosynthesis